MSLPLSFGTRILGAGALLLLSFLGVGWLLPGSWSADARTEVAAPPSEVLSHLDAAAAWRGWTPWPDSGLVAEGAERGPGSRLEWDDRELGDGVFEIVEVADTLVRYRVQVQEGRMTTTGTVRLEATATGTRIHWSESGDFGRNPLMGYWARFMRRAQSREMEKGLRRLAELLEGRDP